MTDLTAITGAGGMLGSSLRSHLESTGSKVLAPSRRELNVSDPASVSEYIEHFDTHSPDTNPGWSSGLDTVYHLAAYVGGVKANSERLATFFHQNAQMGLNLLDACARSRVPKVVSVLSTCVYPDTPYVTLPLTEDQLHLGPPHPSNFGYAYAKRMLDVHTRAIRAQFDLPYITVIPNNLFGPGDNFHLEDGHVIPALMRRIWEAKLSGAPSVTVWGDGSPLREFTYAPDAARILKIVAEEYDDDLPLNIGCTEERSIREVAEALRDALGYEGQISYDTTRPMGQHRKPSSNRRLLELTSWREADYTPFERAVRETSDWFMLQYPNVRGME
jgi:GDP-L-fucose synthase